MRRLLPLLLAALVACQVDTEGAPCRVGHAEDCPSGQGCGDDFRCSASGCKCQGGLVCGTAAGAGACVCPSPTGSFAVAPRSVSDTAPAPTGALEPPECRFRTLTQAIDVAAGAGGGTVIATGGVAGQPPVVFGAGTGETLPITIPAGVTLTTDVSTSGAVYAIQLDDSAATSAVKMHAGAVLAAFVIENVAGDSTRDAVTLACEGATAPVTLRNVTMRGEGVDAEHQLKRGIEVNGTCGVAATDVAIAGMQLEALRVDADVESTFRGGALERSGKGVNLKRGILKLDGVHVQRNAGKGIEADSSGETALELNAVKILDNDDTGLAVMNATRLFVVDSTIFGNGVGSSPTVWGPPSYPNSTVTARKCGGIVLIGAPPPTSPEPLFRFERNRVYSNRGDQVLAMLSGGKSWPLGAAGCGTASTETTVFGCYDTRSSGSSVSYRGLVVIDAIAEASRIAWNSGVAFPGSSTDYKAFGATSAVQLTAVPPSYCILPAELDCGSPDPR